MQILENYNKQPDIRRLYDLRSVLYDKSFTEKAENFDAYYMYRGIDKKDDLRYDITVIPFRMFGEEYPKTKGHYHPENYGEMYIVLEGKAIYLLQNKEVSDVYKVEAEKGDVVIIPPHYGHITINPGKETLYMANWVSGDFSSEYGPILEKGGGAYFYTENGWIRNENYKNLPLLRSEEPQKEEPKDLKFLKNH